MVGYEIERRNPDTKVRYIDVTEDPSVIPPAVDEEIKNRGLFWPVSTINDRIFFDGLLTLPKVAEALEEEHNRDARLAEVAEVTEVVEA